MITYRGLGLTEADCTGGAYTGKPFWSCIWKGIVGYDPTPIGVPPAPPDSSWTIPPASEQSAQATVDDLLRQQLERQQSINASQIVPVIYPISSVTGFNLTPYYPLLIGIGLFSLVAVVGGGSPRRYGR